MNCIKKQLWEDIKDQLSDHKISQSKVEEFLTLDLSKESETRNAALKIIKDILDDHNKTILYPFLFKLSELEEGIKSIYPWHRDHIIHSFNTFLLGVLLKKKFRITLSPFCWKLTSLLHDIGYAFQIGNFMINSTIEELNKNCNELGGIAPKSHIISYFRNIGSITDGRNAFNLIDSRLSEWGININSNEELRKYKFNHGIGSALISLKLLDAIYKNKNPNRKNKPIYYGEFNYNQRYFDRYIVDACTAIFLHDLSMDNKLIYSKKYPLPYLLRLSDILQDWERPSGDRIFGFPSYMYEYEFENNKFKFRVYDDNRRNKIQEQIEILEGLDVEVI